jgi:hypothetical protein
MISLFARRMMLLAVPASMLVLLLGHIACQHTSIPAYEAAANESTQPVALLLTGAPATQPAGSSSVMVYIKMVIEKKYGFLAHVIGNRDYTERDIVYDVKKNWWDNPLIVYADAPFAHDETTGHADAQAIVGEGASANVDVKLMLIPHAVVSLRTTPPSDGIKGTISVSISTVDEFFDGVWTPMVSTKDKRLSFSFDTCEPGRQIQPVAHESRTIAEFSLEHYTRDHEIWESKINWPSVSKSGDARVVIYGKDAVLDVTGYRYAP